MKRRFIILPLISAIILTFASCSEKYFTTDGQTWGTSYHIVYKSKRSMDDSIASTLAMIDRELSMFNPTSTVSRINAGTLDSASAPFAEVFMLAQKINRFSGGVYDPTVGPRTDLWGFGRKEIESQPTDSAITEALASVGIQDCMIDEYFRISKKSQATVFDFSSIAKGYGVDCVGRVLEAAGIENYMIEIGGEVLAKGFNPKGRPWRIQIDSPTSGFGHERLSVATLGPIKTAMASSGNYRNFRTDASGDVYGHTLSPVTGRPVRGMIPAATVVAGDCATADALATACMAAAVPDSALAILGRAGAQGLIVTIEGDSLVMLASPKFPFEH